MAIDDKYDALEKAHPEKKGCLPEELAEMVIRFFLPDVIVKVLEGAASKHSGKNGRKVRQCSRAAGVVGSIGDDPCSAARSAPARPVPSIATHFDLNASVCYAFQEQGEGAH
jgi:hypothetical protein